MRPSLVLLALPLLACSSAPLDQEESAETGGLAFPDGGAPIEEDVVLPPPDTSSVPDTLPVFEAATPDALVPGSDTSDVKPSGPLVAFPGAEGFGANAKGGRGGVVCTVTTLAKSGGGSLQACLDLTGPKTIVFRVSGVIEGPLEIKRGKVTIAGQTSPGTISIKGGLLCDNVYDPNDCNDVIIRHVRFRGGAPDGIRIGGAHDVILDHVSLAGASDENVEITRSQRVTIQNAVIAEPIGDHYRWGGILINYSKDVMPLDDISIHHSVWNGVYGRLPELSCEENGDGPGKSNCKGHVLHLELASNLMFGTSDPIWYNRCTGTNAGNDCTPSANDFFVHLNWVNNRMLRKSGSGPMIEANVWGPMQNQIFWSGNVLGDAVATGGKASIAARHPFPAITETKASELIAYMTANAGAFPRDPMDRRLVGYLAKPVADRPAAWTASAGIDKGDLYAVDPSSAAATDTDGDGMPDAWESAHGFDPKLIDGAKPGTCGAGYTALECFLEERSVARIKG